VFFADPMVWRKPKDLSTACCFSVTNTTRSTSKSKHIVQNILVAFCNEISPSPVPESPRKIITSDDDSNTNAISQEEEEDSINADRNLKRALLRVSFIYWHKNTLMTQGVIHETQIICKSLTKRQMQCFNNISCHGFEFAVPYRALPGFVNDPINA
jgi:hypothetical protein